MSRMQTYAIILTLLQLFCGNSVHSMEFRKNVVREGVSIQATGPIEIGDGIKFRNIAHEATTDQDGLRRVFLESPGGNVAEAMRIGDMIRENNFVTLVNGECASACAMVLYIRPAGTLCCLMGESWDSIRVTIPQR